MHWTIAVPFIDTSNIEEKNWLEAYVPGDRHQFTIVPRPSPLENWHERKTDVASKEEWKQYWQHTSDVFKDLEGGVITALPQLAATVGIRQRFSTKKVPVIAGFFNVGTCSTGFKRWLAQCSLQNIDRFIVHTRREQEIYKQWLGLPKERFEFIPYQVPPIPVTEAEETEEPFIVALGSAHRDYATFFEAVKRLNIPTKVVSSDKALAGLEIPPQVEVMPSNFGRANCRRLAQQGRISVVPMVLNEAITAGGQVTIIEAMVMKRPVIATRCNGADDYIQDGETGFLVDPYSVDSLTQAMDRLWNDPQLRQTIGQKAGDRALNDYSDEAAGKALGQILDAVADDLGQR